MIGALASAFVSTSICLIISWCGGLILAVMWIICVWVVGLTSTILFVLGSSTGLFIAPLFPLSFAWIKQKLNLVPPLLAIIFCGCNLGALILQKIAGKLQINYRMNLLYVLGLVLDYDPNHFATLLTSCIVVTIVLYIILNVIDIFHQRNVKAIPQNDEVLTTDKLNGEEQQIANYLEGANEI